MKPHTHTQKAFTLVELMVVLVIVGLLVTLIMQGFTYSLGVYQRVVISQKNAYSQVMSSEWFRASLTSQVAARPKEEGLVGAANELSTKTFQPLLGDAGIKTNIGWLLQQTNQQLELRYLENGKNLLVQTWSGSTGKFEYLDINGQWVSQWPTRKPNPLDALDIPTLPKAIRLVIQTNKEVRNILVKVGTRLRSEVTMDEVLYGR